MKYLFGAIATVLIMTIYVVDNSTTFYALCTALMCLAGWAYSHNNKEAE